VKLFESGDLVRLKSGGPVITVVQVSRKEDEPMATCAWFDRDHEFHREAFVAAALARVEYGEMPLEGTYRLLNGDA